MNLGKLVPGGAHLDPDRLEESFQQEVRHYRLAVQHADVIVRQGFHLRSLVGSESSF